MAKKKNSGSTSTSTKAQAAKSSITGALQLYESGVAAIAAALSEGDDDEAARLCSVVSRVFGRNMLLRRELDAQRALVETRGMSARAAERMISRVRELALALPVQQLREATGSAVTELRVSSLSQSPASTLAAEAFSSWRSPPGGSQMLESVGCEEAIAELLTSPAEESQLGEVTKPDPLVMKLVIEKFNAKYVSLSEGQRELLRLFALGESADALVRSMRDVRAAALLMIREHTRAKKLGDVTDARLGEVKKLLESHEPDATPVSVAMYMSVLGLMSELASQGE